MLRFLLLLLLLSSSVAIAQNELLAKNYFEQGAYEKARTIFEKLYEKEPERLDYLTSLVETYQQLELYKEAETLLQKKLQGRRPIPQLYVELGYNYALQEKTPESERAYQQAIDFIEVNSSYAYPIGGAFENYSLLDQAIIAYEKAMELDPTKDFNFQLARIYGEQGKLEKMFNKYLSLIQGNTSFRSTAQRNFSTYITEDPLNEANVVLRKLLLQKIQQEQDVLYNKLLSWLFIQQKEFKKAFTQEKAIYKREGEDLSGIAELGVIAITEKDYENAREIMTFLIENSFTPEAKLQGYQYLMKIELQTALPTAYASLETKFEEVLKEFGTDTNTYLFQIDYNHFLAFEAGKKEKAIENLKQLLKKKLSPYQEARVKMELSDILVFDEQFNQALIYYSQIQNKVKSDVLAQEARFKVARTSYFKGDFEWAQVQLDVLRKSASQLIANDAMQLSLMISDNTLEDSTQTALKKYARADLLSLQNKNQEAIAVLEDILTEHKGEKMEDEALLQQGKLYEKTGDFAKAEASYSKIIDFHKDDILSDDAHFLLAKLYEEQLQQPDKAKQMYEQIIFEYADSIYFIEARKKFRSLRGDLIN